jgi:hypothetical protein
MKGDDWSPEVRGHNPRRLPGWEPVATQRQVEAKLRELINRLDTADERVRGSLSESLPDAKVLEVHVHDLDAIYWTEMSGGQMGKLTSGPSGRPDIRVQLSSDDLVDLVDGRRSLFSSYLSGHVKIEASLGDLMRLRRFA